MLQREKLACSWCLGDADGRDVELSGLSGCFLLDVSEGLDGGQTEIVNYLSIFQPVSEGRAAVYGAGNIIEKLEGRLQMFFLWFHLVVDPRAERKHHRKEGQETIRLKMFILSSLIHYSSFLLSRQISLDVKMLSA